MRPEYVSWVCLLHGIPALAGAATKRARSDIKVITLVRIDAASFDADRSRITTFGTMAVNRRVK